MKILLLVVLFLPIIGCQTHFARKLDCITPLPNSCSFLAILETDTVVGKESVEYYSLVRIDSTGAITMVSQLDRSFRHFKTVILNDSTILYDSYREAAIKLYHVRSNSLIDLVKGVRLAGICDGGNIFVATDTNHYIKGLTSYQIQNDTIQKIGFTSLDYSYLRSFDEKQFICSAPKSWNIGFVIHIVNPDFSIFDSLDQYTYWYDDLYISKAQRKNKICLIGKAGSAESPNTVQEYDLSNRKVDTVFSGMYFSGVFPLKDSNVYLIRGKKISEYKDEENRRHSEYVAARKEGGYIDYGPQTGYWMIGNKETKKIKKIGYDEYTRPIISSDGRYILFLTGIIHTLGTNMGEDIEVIDDFKVEVKSVRDILH
jgi:hypothetical protein